MGLILSGFGLIHGFYTWINGITTSNSTQTGTLVLVAMSSLAGLRLLLAFLSYDTNNLFNSSSSIGKILISPFKKNGPFARAPQ